MYVDHIMSYIAYNLQRVLTEINGSAVECFTCDVSAVVLNLFQVVDGKYGLI